MIKTFSIQLRHISLFSEAAKTSCRMSSIRAPEFVKTAKFLPRFDSKFSFRPFVRELPKTKHLIQLLWVFSSAAVSSFSIGGAEGNVGDSGEV